MEQKLQSTRLVSFVELNAIWVVLICSHSNNLRKKYGGCRRISALTTSRTPIVITENRHYNFPSRHSFPFITRNELQRHFFSSLQNNHVGTLQQSRYESVLQFTSPFKLQTYFPLNNSHCVYSVRVATYNLFKENHTVCFHFAGNNGKTDKGGQRDCVNLYYVHIRVSCSVIKFCEHNG